MSFPPAPARFFASDNFSGAHPRYLSAVERANSGHVMAYGGDEITKHATKLFQELCDTDVDVLFTFNGTGSNIVALGSLLRSAESVLCSEWAHIHVDETGAPEHILGIKLQDVNSPDAKVTPAHIVSAASALGNVHHV